MYWTLLWETVLLVLGGTFLLRVAGRKSISQMTIAQTIIMISFGTLLIEPVTGKGYWTTFFTGAILISTLIAMEYLQLKTDWMERILTGKAVVVIENGQINEANMSKMRLTVDRLEMRLRQLGVSSLADVQTATLEVSGDLGFELIDQKKPATKEDIQNLQRLLENVVPGFASMQQDQQNPPPSRDPRTIIPYQQNDVRH